jgi:hypothetical protein
MIVGETSRLHSLNPPIEYTVYKRLLGSYNDLYSMWQQTITENAALRQQIQARFITRHKKHPNLRTSSTSLHTTGIPSGL